MTRVMDGVRRGQVVPAPLVRQPRVQRAAASVEAAPAKFVVGMYGVRRPLRPIGPVVAAGWAEPAAGVPKPQVRRWQPPVVPWRRVAMAGGLTVVALSASVATVRFISTPRTTTAHAEASASTPQSTPSTTPAQADRVGPQKTGLQTLLNTFAAANPGKFSIVVKDLGSGDTASVDQDRVMESASLYKLFVADQIYHEIDAGQISATTKAGGGSGNTVQGCLSLMITISDNTCGRALGTMLNWGAQNPALAAQGYTETNLATPQQTSARDVALLFQHLYEGELNSAASNGAFMNLLKAQKVNDRLPQGLPANTVIAHKTGNLDDAVHDGGIVYGPKTNYLVVVMSDGWSAPGNVPAMFANLSQQLWGYFEN